MKRTPWFDGRNVDPVHPGVYETRPFDGRVWFSRWTGKVWMLGDFTAAKAAREDLVVERRENRRPGDKWRGLAKKP